MKTCQNPVYYPLSHSLFSEQHAKPFAWQADYTITYDKKHLLKIKRFESTKIVTPTEFLKILRKTEKNRKS